MAWLPFEDDIAGKSESLILQYNPLWTDCREERHAISIPEAYADYFTIDRQEVFDLYVPFTREGWNGRIKTCRGIGASLTDAKIESFIRDHLKLLSETAPPEFKVLHYAAMTVLKKK